MIQTRRGAHDEQEEEGDTLVQRLANGREESGLAGGAEESKEDPEKGEQCWRGCTSP